MYGVRVARKTLVSPATAEESFRFKQEFETMSKLSFPYILDVYRYDENNRSYTMEYCESTLDTYIQERNDDEKFDKSSRRRIALQFLYGLNYLHLLKYCHRDLSYNNILVKRYDKNAVIVKLSDFGFAKHDSSTYTKTSAEIFGSITDPSLEDFKNFEPINDIYPVGFILNFIFTGRKSLKDDESAISAIIHKCLDAKPANRYQTVLEIIEALDHLKLSPQSAST